MPGLPLEMVTVRGVTEVPKFRKELVRKLQVDSVRAWDAFSGDVPG